MDRLCRLCKRDPQSLTTDYVSMNDQPPDASVIMTAIQRANDPSLLRMLQAYYDRFIGTAQRSLTNRDSEEYEKREMWAEVARVWDAVYEVPCPVQKEVTSPPSVTTESKQPLSVKAQSIPLHIETL